MKKVIIFNAPPCSGKDVASEFVVKGLTSIGIKAQHKEVKENLFRATKACFGVSQQQLEILYSRENKDKPCRDLIIDGKMQSIRQAMINTSENVLKPLFGNNVFGIMAAKSLEEGVNIFSDGGFKEEVEELRDEVGRDNILLIQILREGYTFEGDSRSYVEVEGVKTIKISNNGAETDFLEDSLIIVEDWLDEE